VPAGRPWVVAVITTRRSTAGIPRQREPGVGTAVPAAVAGQIRPVDQVVTVAGSALAVVGPVPPFPTGAVDDAFVWFLDESSRPAPDALDRLLACAALDPGAAILGPTGVTVDRSGCRLPAPGEPMAVRDVLAVEWAGTLIRAQAWRLLNGANPVAGRAQDLDLCWRAWRAGLRVVAVPGARLRPGRAEDEAGSERARRTDALRVRIAHGGLWAVPVTASAVSLACLGQVAGALARGKPRSAGVEALVLGGALAEPARLWRLARYAPRRGPIRARALRGLLPRPARPWLTERSISGTEPPSGRRTRAFFLARPATLLTMALVAAGCLLTGGGRGADGPVAAPPGAAELWSDIWSGWLGPAGGLLGGPGPAPSWAPLLAAAASALGGRPELAVRVLLAVAVAGAGLAAYGATGTLPGLQARRWRRAGLAAAYALSPPVTGAAWTGDLAAVGSGLAAPLLLGAAGLVLAPAGARADSSGGGRAIVPRRGRAVVAARGRAERRRAVAAGHGWAAAWALAGALLLGVACAPGLFALALVGLTAAGFAARSRPGSGGSWRLAGRLGGALLIGGAPLLPALGAAARGGPVGLVGVLVVEPGHAGADPGSFKIFALVCLLAAVLGGRAGRLGAGACWLVAAVGWVGGQDPLVAAGLTAGVAWALAAPAEPVGRSRTEAAARPRGVRPAGRPGWSGRGDAVTSVVLATVLLAGPGLLFVRASGWLGGEPASARASATAAAGDRSDAAMLPSSGPDRALVLVPSTGRLTYTLTGGHGPTMVDAAGDPAPPAREFLAAVVADLSVGGGWGAAALPAFGVGEVRVPATGVPAAAGSVPAGSVGVPAGAAVFEAGALLAALDAAPGLEREQGRPGGYTWRLVPAAGPVAPLRLLPPNVATNAMASPGTPASAAESAAGAGDVDGAAMAAAAPSASAARARAAAAARIAVGPALPLEGPVRSSGTTTMDARLPAGPAGRLLVLTEPADSGWQADLAGRRLTPVAAWGWAQAFVVPGGPAEPVRVRYDHGPHHALVVGEAALVAVFLLAGPRAARRSGRRRADATGWRPAL
jgi:hypothetical protein